MQVRARVTRNLSRQQRTPPYGNPIVYMSSVQGTSLCTAPVNQHQSSVSLWYVCCAVMVCYLTGTRIFESIHKRWDFRFLTQRPLITIRDVCPPSTTLSSTFFSFFFLVLSFIPMSVQDIACRSGQIVSGKHVKRQFSTTCMYCAKYITFYRMMTRLKWISYIMME